MQSTHKSTAGVKIQVPISLGELGFGKGLIGAALDKPGFELIFRPIEGATHRIGQCSYRFQGRKWNEEDLALLWFAFELVAKTTGSEPGCYEVDIQSKVPLGLGLGDPLSLLVGGALAANAFSKNPLSMQELLALLCEQSPWLQQNPEYIPALGASILGGLQWLVDPAKGHFQRLFYPPGLFFALWQGPARSGIAENRIPAAIGNLLYGLLQSNLGLITRAYADTLEQADFGSGDARDYLGAAGLGAQLSFVLCSKDSVAREICIRRANPSLYSDVLQLTPTGALLV